MTDQNYILGTWNWCSDLRQYKQIHLTGAFQYGIELTKEEVTILKLKYGNVEIINRTTFHQVIILNTYPDSLVELLNELRPPINE